MYYRGAATGSFIMARTGPWHVISSNGYQVLSFSSMLDPNDDPSTVPVSFDRGPLPNAGFQPLCAVSPFLTASRM